jgi:quercetin dioxygenase-like cupin family protein
MRMISLLTLGLLAVVVTVSCAQGASEADPVAISPRFYTVLLDSNHVRVLEYRLPAGRREPMHSHPAYVVYFFQAAKLRAIFPDGRSSESLVTPGETLYREALTHSIENIGDTEVHALLVEFAGSQ